MVSETKSIVVGGVSVAGGFVVSDAAEVEGVVVGCVIVGESTDVAEIVSSWRVFEIGDDIVTPAVTGIFIAGVVFCGDVVGDFVVVKGVFVGDVVVIGSILFVGGVDWGVVVIFSSITKLTNEGSSIGSSCIGGVAGVVIIFCSSNLCA